MRPVVVLVAVGAGCSFSKYRASYSASADVGCSDLAATADTVAGALFSAAAIALPIAIDGSKAQGADIGVVLTGIVFGLPAALYDISAIHGWRGHSRCVDTQREILIQSATAAARAGDCEAVAKLDAEGGELDPTLHNTFLFRDEAIASCLAKNKEPRQPWSAPSTPEPPPPPCLAGNEYAREIVEHRERADTACRDGRIDDCARERSAVGVAHAKLTAACP